MKCLAALAVLLIAPATGLAEEIQVVTDPQGVQTYTNLPRRKTPIKVKDQHGVRVLTNGNGSGKHQPPTADEEIRSSTPAPTEPMPETTPLLGLDPDLAPPRSSAAQGSAAGGQWVYTQQNGWIWLPYGNQYVSEGSADDETPYAYAYDPSYGWTWLAAPWIWGWGAYPYFGASGPWRFGWYRGLLHSGYGWGGYRGGAGHAGVGRGLAGGAFRGGVGVRGGNYGRGFGGGGRFRGGGGGFRGASAPAHRFSNGGTFGGGGHGGGRGGGGHGGGGHR